MLRRNEEDGLDRKSCVFCGNPPSKKNKEHVIPQWLIKHTGNPSRKARFGISFDPNTEKFIEPAFAFNRFVFPACEACNSEFALLEENAKKSILSLMSKEEITTTQMSDLLDWFDKLRVGLWLAMWSHHTNPVAPSPNYYIKQRLGQFDRVLIVEEMKPEHDWLGFTGVSTNTFMFMPSAFALRINNFIFTNISTFSLVSRRLGFPYSKRSFLLPDSDAIQYQITRGLERVIKPIFRKRIRENGVIIAQPMMKSDLALSPVKDSFESDYGKAHSLKSGYGNIFVEFDGKVQEYSKSSNISLPELNQLDSNYWEKTTGFNVIEWQDWLLNNFSSSDEKLPKEQKKFVRDKLKFIKMTNRLLIKYMKSSH
jgi:hypothetical protein